MAKKSLEPTKQQRNLISSETTSQTTSTSDCNWLRKTSKTFNPPLESHFRGVRERLAVTNGKEESTNSAGHSEANTFSFPDSCGRGRGNLDIYRPLIHVGCRISDEGLITY